MADAPSSSDDAPTRAQWRQLTALAPKREQFRWDHYFREAWADVVAVMGPEAGATLHHTALVNLKPDAVVGRRGGRVLDFLEAHGFVPRTARRFEFTRHGMRELWRYDWHVYPVDRLRFSTFWYTSGDVMAVLLTDVTPEDGVPASARLAALKGPANPAERTPNQLRTVLAPPNPVLNFVHVADEPADVVRELGILLDTPARRAALARVLPGDPGCAPGREEAWGLLATLESEQPPHDLDLDLSLARIAAAPGVGSTAVAAVRDHLERGTHPGWDELTGTGGVGAGRVDRWDLITVASSVLRRELGVPGDLLMPSVSAAEWAGR